MEIDKLESGAASDQLVEGLVTNVDTALHTGTMDIMYNVQWIYDHDHVLTLAMKVLSRGQPSARAATPAAVIISHQERFTLTSWSKSFDLTHFTKRIHLRTAAA